MRILHVLHNSLPLLCGYSIRSGYIVNLERAMGLDPWVVTSGQHPNGEAMNETIAGTEYRRTLGARQGRVPLAREWQLMKTLEREVEIAARELRPDVIHAHSPVLVGLPALRVARKLDIGMVYEIRDLWENASVDRGRFGAGSPLYTLARGLESYVVRNADAVVTICDLLKHELAPRAGRANKVRVIANGVDAENFHPLRPNDELRRKWRLDGKEIVLYAGTFQPYEGLDLLVRAMVEVVRHRPQAHLVIVGGSAGFAGGTAPASVEEQRLAAAVKEFSVESHVTFTGRIPHGEMKEMYALADVLAYPRRLTRTTALTTPLKPLEPMAMAKAVIASDVPAMKEIVSDGVTGLLFKAGDHEDLAAKCVALLSDPARRTNLGLAAREWILRERRWPSLVAQYRGIYESVVRSDLPSAEKIPA
jgi:PEP-CTERM/exosortase A-associated glycosyltransferase